MEAPPARSVPAPRECALDGHVHAALPGLALGGVAILTLSASIDLLRSTAGSISMGLAELALATGLAALVLMHQQGKIRPAAAEPIVIGVFLAFSAVVTLGAFVDLDRSLVLLAILIPIVASVFVLHARALTPIVLANALILWFALSPLTSGWEAQSRITALAVLVAAPFFVLASRVRTHRELQRVVEDAQESADQQRALFHASPLAKWTYDDVTLEILDVNAAAVKAYGHSRERFLQMRVSDLWHPDDVQEKLERRQRDGRSRVREVDTRHVKADGTILRVIVTSAPVPDRKRPTRMAVVQDVTERVKAQEALRQSDLRFQYIAKATKDVVWDWDLVTNDLTWNDNFYDTFGHTPEAVGPGIASWTRFIHPDDSEGVHASLRRAIDGGAERWEAEYRFQRADGTYAQVYDRGYILHDAHGRPIRMVGSMQDVTSFRQAEATQRRQERLTALGTLVAGVAHEINNPLTYIQGNVELSRLAIEDVLRDPQLPADERESLADAFASQEKVLLGVGKIAQITRGLRQVARSGEGPREAASLGASVAGVLEVARVRFKDDVLVTTEVSDQRLVRANVTEISQIILNLLINAADAVRGRPDPHVHLAVKDDANEVVLEVRDNGVGIPPEARARIFTPFYTTKADGTGLGLSVSESIARDHGGSLEFESAPGRGTTFRLRLPAIAKYAAPPASA